MDHCHPNFPPGLSIAPNVGFFTGKVQEHPLENDIGDAFGVEAQQEAISRYGIAGRVWEAAYALCAYVEPAEGNVLDFDPPFVDDPHEPLGAIELGSGTGVVAASIARVVRHAVRPGGFVIATDLPDVCPLLEHNLGVNTEREANRSDSDAVFVRPLTWGILGHATSIASEFGLVQPFASRRLTHIVCSDLASTVVYFPELLGPLLRTLIHLTSASCALSSGPPTKIVISYKIRSLPKETPFWTAFGLWFSFQPVLARRRVRPVVSKNVPPGNKLDASEPWRRFGADEDAGRTFVFVAHRRPESITWHVPKSDKELMEGVGARGTTTKKGDDTFETILFMAMGIDNTSA
ncbi:putative methyltransferase-domain-containing protein [Butyriboletus roseoflavus]|nr:putative methyltransferase-domain-containing protein [Butyriboletus roseoflavus]